MLIFFLVSFAASTVGAICGIGGGVIIKPVLDLLHLGSAAAVSFLSGCTVLSMSCYSVGRSLLSGEKRVSLRTGTPLAIGAAAGGLLGNQLFSVVKGMFENPDRVASVQALCLAVVTIGTMLYMLNRQHIRTRSVENGVVCVTIGLGLGCMSSFLGIGGGPINLMVLYYFFSMDTKTAAANSLYIILFSQFASLCKTLLGRTVPPFHWLVLALMAAGGIGGGVLGRAWNQRMGSHAVERLFTGLMAVIVAVSLYNSWRYAV